MGCPLGLEKRRGTRPEAFLGEPSPYLPNRYAALSSEVQCGQRVALMGMLKRQYEHSLVEGAAGAGFGWRCILLICRTSKKIANATIRKSITVLRNSP